MSSLFLKIISTISWRRGRSAGPALICCLLLAMLLISLCAKAEEMALQGVPQPLFVASFPEPVPISASAAAFCPPLPAAWLAEPATGSLVCLLQFPDGSPFQRSTMVKDGLVNEYDIKYRCLPSGSTGFLNHSRTAEKDACHVFAVASFPADATQVTFSFWCKGYRRSQPSVVKLLPDLTASPSRIILRLLHEEPIVWTFRDPEGRPIASAVLELYDQGFGFGQKILSDASGAIILPGEVGEPYTTMRFICSAPGYVDYRCKLKPEQVLHNQEFILRPDVSSAKWQKYKRSPVELPIPAVSILEDATVEFTLLDLYSGLPIASKSVIVSNLSAAFNNCQSPYKSTRGLTDAEGRLTVKGLLPWWNFFNLSVEGYGSKAFRGHGHAFTQPVFVWPGQKLIRQTLRLRPGRKIRIQIHDSEKQPKSGCRAMIGRIPNRSLVRWIFYSETTDADGWVELEDIAYRGLELPFPDATGKKYIDVASISEDGIVRVYEPVARTVWGWLELDMVHADGRKFCEEDIVYSLCWTDKQARSGSVNCEEKTRLQLVPGSYTIRLYGEYHSDLLEFEIRPGETTSRLAKMFLTRPYVVRLRVIDHAGRPIAGLRVHKAAPPWRKDEHLTNASGIIDLPVSTTHSVASCTVRYYLYRPDTAECQQINYPWQSLNVPAVDGSGAGHDRSETVTIRHGGKVSLQMPEELSGQWFSAALFPQNPELNPDQRIVNFQANTSGDQILIDDLTPGDYWLVVANDQKVAESLVRKGAIWPSLYREATITGYFSRFAAAGIASVSVCAGQTTSVGKVNPETL
ncbi:MAG TPA: hypothetical protein DCG57_05505, partial [Candidatus Riflebacteria bacterium]|nr:hypothetical protein [Candidatus Riflebacteria bacterium]